MLITTYSSLLFRRAVSVRVVGDEGCERIHKEKKVQRVKVYFHFPKVGEGGRCGDMHQHQH